MDEYLNKSEFYHFEILPKVCIHSIQEDKYSKMYKPRDKCECGCSEWIISTMIVNVYLPEKDVYRCKSCNEIRLSDHIGLKE